MDRFDEKIIGYESTKNILRQIRLKISSSPC